MSDYFIRKSSPEKSADPIELIILFREVSEREGRGEDEGWSVVGPDMGGIDAFEKQFQPRLSHFRDLSPSWHSTLNFTDEDKKKIETLGFTITEAPQPLAH
ncbi:MAG: hypothetical protein H6869_05915 [Rhodospirillales bacterium]|nr:hypothetical protein [Rhodospirillales bacterium]